MFFAHYGEGSINAHRTGRFNAVFCHRQNHVIYVFKTPAECLVKFIPFFLGAYRNFVIRNFYICKGKKVLIQPFSVRMLACIIILDFFVCNKSFLLCVYQKHFARHQAAFCDNVLFVNVQNADFAGKNKHIILCNVVAARAQAVSVQSCAENVTVTEQNCGRSIPGFHHGCPVVIKILCLLAYCVVVLPALGNTNKNCKGKRHSVH